MMERKDDSISLSILESIASELWPDAAERSYLHTALPALLRLARAVHDREVAYDQIAKSGDFAPGFKTSLEHSQRITAALAAFDFGD